MRYFNTEGQCDPQIHYMVNIDERLKIIKERFVERGSYFIINRGRQYGKTTTLRLLEDYLKIDYLVLSMDFQELTTANFQDEPKFVKAFIRCFVSALEECQDKSLGLELRKQYAAFVDGRNDMGELFEGLSGICRRSAKPVVLMIDEVDSASNNRVFIDFLGMLRRYFLNRARRPIFHSVILAGVYDIKNLKLKIRPEEEHQYNSPWNIAADFDLNMSFLAEQITAMLGEYEADHCTGMDTAEVAEEIYRYTAGYPYLVSLVCKIMDEKLPQSGSLLENVWEKRGVAETVKIILKLKTPLFDSMIKQIDAYRDLRNVIELLLYQGRRISFSPAEKSINLGLMFGFLKEENGHVAVANRIFEMYLLDLFIAEESVKSEVFFSGRISGLFSLRKRLYAQL